MPADRSVPRATRRGRPATDKSNVACPFCDRVLARNTDLKRHLESHGDKKYQCTVLGCGFATTSAQSFKVHTDNHNGIKKPCPEAGCEYSSSDPSILLRHRKRNHDYVPRKVAPRRKRATDYVPPVIPDTIRRAISTQEIKPKSRFYQFVTFADGREPSFSVSPSPSYSSSSSRDTEPWDQEQQTNNCDAECQTPSSEEYHHQHSYPAQSVPGFDAAGFTDSDHQTDDLLRPVVRSQKQARIPREALNVNNQTLSLEHYTAATEMLDMIFPETFRSAITSPPTSEDYLAAEDMLNKLFTATSRPFITSTHVNENNYNYTDIVIGEQTPTARYLDAEERYSHIPPPFTSWTHFLNGPLTSTQSVMYHC